MKHKVNKVKQQPKDETVVRTFGTVCPGGESLSIFGVGISRATSQSQLLALERSQVGSPREPQFYYNFQFPKNKARSSQDLQSASPSCFLNVAILLQRAILSALVTWGPWNSPKLSA